MASDRTAVDKVFIEGLEIEALIGIYDWERRIRQPLLFDLEMAFDNRRPAASDAIADTLDYKAVSKRLIAFVSASEFGLVETLAERCAELVLREFDVAHVRLKLSKPGAVRGARAVGVIIERSRAADPAGAEPRTVAADSVPAAPAASGEARTDDGVPAPPAPRSEPAAPPIPEPMVGSRAAQEAILLAAADAASGPRPAPPPDPLPPPPPLPAPPPAPASPPLPPGQAQVPQPSRPRNPATALGRSTRPAYLSLGSNIDPVTNLRSAVRALRARFGEIVLSPVYRIPAVGFTGPDFLNAAAIIDSDLDPFSLVAWLQGLERAHGRMRGHVKNSDRTLDMDIVYFDSVVLDLPGRLQLPRPELRHAFVLKPLADIAPDFVDPVRGVSLAELWAAHPEHGTVFERVAL